MPQKAVRRKHIKQFSGFPEGTDLAKKKELLEKQTKSMLQQVSRKLGLGGTSDRDELVARLLTFLERPTALAKASKAANTDVCSGACATTQH